MPRYKVRHHTEEFDCPQCGAPVYVGDSAWQDDAETAPFCSAYCAGADPKVNQQAREDAYNAADFARDYPNGEPRAS